MYIKLFNYLLKIGFKLKINGIINRNYILINVKNEEKRS